MGGRRRGRDGILATVTTLSPVNLEVNHHVHQRKNVSVIGERRCRISGTHLKGVSLT